MSSVARGTIGASLLRSSCSVGVRGGVGAAVASSSSCASSSSRRFISSHQTTSSAAGKDGNSEAGPSSIRSSKAAPNNSIVAAASSSSSSPSSATSSSSAASTSQQNFAETRKDDSNAPQPTTLEESSDSSSSYTTPGSVKYAMEDRKPLPLLSAPLGVSVRPSSRKLSFVERREQAFDHDRRMKKRKAIVKEAARGYFSDFHAMRSHGGKTWKAPSTLIRQDRSLYFPSIIGTSLATNMERNTADILPGKVSIVCIMTSVLSEQHAKSFYEAALDVYQKDSNFQLVQINLQENRLKAYVVSFFTNSLRSKIPESLQPTYLLSHQDVTMEREDIGLHNKHVGYTYLVGPDGKIRWAAGAFAEKEERQALVACTGVLLSRLSEEQRGRK